MSKIKKDLPLTLKNEDKVSEKGMYCYGKKDFCHKWKDCRGCEFYNGEGGKFELLLINQDKSNIFDVKSNEELFKQALIEGVNRRIDREIEKEKQIEEMAEYMAYISHSECGIKSCDDCKHCGKTSIETADCTDYLIAEALYNAGYRKQSEVVRCKDCKYCYQVGKIKACRHWNSHSTTDDAYCSYAEMKGGE